jgi:putative ABC transport system permease protein
MRHLAQDIRYALRTFRKTPGPVAVALVALTLGIGANTAIFSVINAILIRPLPYPDPDALLLVWGNKIDKGIHKLRLAPPDYRDLVEQNQSFDQMGAFRTQSSVLIGKDLPERVETAAVSPSVLRILGMQPVRGRIFAADEDQPSKNSVVVLGDRIWRDRFGGDPNALGATLNLDGKAYTIVGIASPDFRLADTQSELWFPYTPAPAELSPSRRGYRSLFVIGHLRSGVTRKDAEAQMQVVARRIAALSPDTNAGYGIEVVNLGEQMVGNVGSTLWTLFGAVLFILLISCANVANLLLARARTREKEIAVRTSLGAQPGRIFSQLLTESIVLATIGGALSIALAYWTTSVLLKLAPSRMPRAHEISVDWRVLVFTLAVSVLSGVLFGLAPALSSIRLDLNSTLKATGRGGTAQRSRTRTRDALVISEAACCVMLLAGAGLLIRSFIALERVNPGFRTDHVLTMQIALPPARYPGMKVALFYQQLLNRLRSLGGMQSMGICRFLPLDGSDASLNFRIEGRPLVASGDQPRAKFRAASEGYFEALGIPLIEGRLFDRTDDLHTPKAVVINQTAARRYWPNEDPVGKRILSGVDESEWTTVIGVVGDVRHTGLDAEVNPETYYHYLQIPADAMNFAEASMALVIRTNADPAALTAGIRKEVQSLDAGQPVFSVRTMQDVVEGSVAQPRFRTLLLSIFAGIAVLLAATGVYGAMSYSVTQRFNEFGIRAALGAQPADLLKLVVGHGIRLVVIGIAIGLVAALLGARVLANLLFHVHQADPITFVLTCLSMLLVAILASFIPGLRATRVDPAVALRNE